MNRQRNIKILVFIVCLLLLFAFYKFIAQPKLKATSLNNLRRDTSENDSAEHYSLEQNSCEIDNWPADSVQILNSDKNTVKRKAGSDAHSAESMNSEQSAADGCTENSLTFPVHIMGAVKQPGVYQANAGMIIQDVIELSGGLNTDADLLLINLAQPVQPNTKIYIPNTAEIEQDLLRYEMTFNSKTDLFESKSASERSNKVNINTADYELLQTLTGIGPVKAQAILDFREQNGKFQTIEELMSVPGIKEAGFAKIKDRIVVN